MAESIPTIPQPTILQPIPPPSILPPAILLPAISGAPFNYPNIAQIVYVKQDGPNYLRWLT
jgi:hypothetical protein